MLVFLRTIFALGLLNLLRAARYKLSIKFRVGRVFRLRSVAPVGPFFPAAISEMPGVPPVSGWDNSGLLFGSLRMSVSEEPPSWFIDPLSGRNFKGADSDWWKIPDFGSDNGDIKVIWELSRFDWVVAFAQRARSGQATEMLRLNNWLSDWCHHNPPFRGPNWKCGQEAAIRVMQLAITSLLIENLHDVKSGLRALVRIHLERIEPTLQYAVAQDNNHGTSEGAALFIGGSWLELLGDLDGSRWKKIGISLLESRAVRLIGADGSFSQHSVNYHRLMLDTYSLVEIWRNRVKADLFSAQLYQRMCAATVWLYHLVDQVSGDAPNVGANDGARLLALTGCDYRDFRPSVQLAMALFLGKKGYPNGDTSDELLKWLGVEPPTFLYKGAPVFVADDGGFAVLRRASAMVLLRYPRFKFRPSQADALHLDLWVAGINILRDAGTYSYNTSKQWMDYFTGAVAHNTVQFDGREQMPRLSRFLFGDWLKTNFRVPVAVTKDFTRFGAGYIDSNGAEHRRSVVLGNNRLQVFDVVSGMRKGAVLRWRLAPGAWRLDGTSEHPRVINDSSLILTVSSSTPIVRCGLVEGWESRYYFSKNRVPVLEVEVQAPGTLITEVRWAE